MRKLLVCAVVLGLLSPISFTVFSKELKIGYVDVFKIFNEYEKTKEYDKKLEEKKNTAEKDLEKKKESLEKMQTKLDVLKAEEKTKEQAKITDAVKEYRELERKTFFDIKKERDDKMKEIVEDINKIIEDYAQKNGFDLIVNQNALLYGAKVMDITTTILDIANSKYKKK
jgi:outer membrane protein